MITADVYRESFKKSRKTLAKRINAFKDDQFSDNVHDLRTASRRLLACFRLLPKSFRKRKMIKRYSEGLEELIKRNATIRDIDIILSKISSRSDATAYEQLVRQLSEQRTDRLRSSLRVVESVMDLARPSINQEDLSDDILQIRFEKVNRKLESKIKERLPIVLGDPAKKRDLHRLREDSRRLRYVLDLAGTPDSAEPMALLRSWQDILGLIHDSDIMIDYLQGEKMSPEIQDLFRDEVAERNRNYEKFASMATTKLALRLSERHS